VLQFLQSYRQPDRFQSLLKRGSRRWYNACLRITGDADLAADAVQEALLKAWRRRDEFRGDSDLDTWIHRIALNAAIDLVRRRKPQLQILAHEEVVANLAMATPALSPESDYAHEALGKDLAGAMNRLTTIERQAFLLKHIEGWRLEEIAQSQQTSVNNAKQTLFRAVRKLRTDLQAWRGPT
jgi:RNA polymerase sigma-70 factor (ECF subfamily)